jgi:hypothetical protein
MASRDKKRVVSIRIRRPSGHEEIEVRLESPDYDDVDAIFTSVDVVEKMLVPFYDARHAGSGKELSKEVREQAKDGVCMVLHKLSCGRIVPPINWNATSPIVL